MGNATKEYHKLLQYILDNGKDKGDRTGTGTKSIFDYKIKFDMSEGFPLMTTKKIHTRSIIHELLWFLKGDTNTKYLNENGVTIWDEWADENGDLGPVYGNQWVKWSTMGKMGDYILHDGERSINQIQNAIDTLNNNPDSRRIMVSAWNVGEIYQMALPPCHWAFELYTEELTDAERKKWVLDNVDWVKDDHDANKYLYRGEPKIYGDSVPKRRLHLKWHQRSVDTFLGLPFNIASYALLLHMFAQQTNMVPGTLVGDLTNVHIYDNHIEYVKEQLDRAYSRYSDTTLELSKSKDIFSYTYEDFEIVGYESFPNWKNVPIAV